MICSTFIYVTLKKYKQPILWYYLFISNIAHNNPFSLYNIREHNQLAVELFLIKLAKSKLGSSKGAKAGRTLASCTSGLSSLQGENT